MSGWLAETLDGGLWVDRCLTGVVWLVCVAVTGTFVWILGDVFWHGVSQVSLEFLIESPRNAGRSGGIGPILVSTGLILAVSLAVSLPIGVGAAVWLAEYTREGTLFGRLIRRSLDVLAGVPSIVFGLFGNAFFSQVLGLGLSILAGGLTLACMVLPLLIRTVEEGLRSVPDSYRSSAAALGLSRSTTLVHLLLPAAAPALIVGVILGTGRALAETAALVFTSGYVDRMPASLLDSGRALSIHVYDLSMNVAGGNAKAYASALVLVLVLLLINGASAWMGVRWLQRRIVPG